jgi:hypothetical protein
VVIRWTFISITHKVWYIQFRTAWSGHISLLSKGMHGAWAHPFSSIHLMNWPYLTTFRPNTHPSCSWKRERWWRGLNLDCPGAVRWLWLLYHGAPYEIGRIYFSSFSNREKRLIIDNAVVSTPVVWIKILCHAYLISPDNRMWDTMVWQCGNPQGSVWLRVGVPSNGWMRVSARLGVREKIPSSDEVKCML